MSVQNRRPVAVLISDVHYNMKNLALADAAMRQAIDKADELNTPLIIAGDLHDTKANLRGECVNAMITTFEQAHDRNIRVTLLTGNHDRINEKSVEHSLEFLSPYCMVVKHPCRFTFHYIPYQHDPAEFERILSDIPKGSTVICHQGVTGAESGEYTYDKSAVNKEIFADYRVISGHYHRAQDIKCGRPQKGAVGLFSYIGSPYTMTFAEANDGPKGFQVLYNDGTLEQIPTNLRKHIIGEYTTDELRNWSDLCRAEDPSFYCRPGDLMWVKVSGPRLELDLLSKDYIKDVLSLDNNSFKLDKIPTDTPTVNSDKIQKKNSNEIMDLLIDESPESQSEKDKLKNLYRKVMS